MDRSIYLKSSDEWAFGNLAEKLSYYLRCPISADACSHCYLLSEPEKPADSYIPRASIDIASDKVRMEFHFSQFNVPRPETLLLSDAAQVDNTLQNGREYLLKFPTSCGANGHYLAKSPFTPKRGWPKPYLLQEFIRAEKPKVYRVYFVSGIAIGSNVRKFDGDTDKILVAHAQGARYAFDEDVPPDGVTAARNAIVSTGLDKSFGVVDLIRDREGRWLVLEIGTDGIYNIVDRDYSNDRFDSLLHTAISISFNEWCASSSSY